MNDLKELQGIDLPQWKNQLKFQTYEGEKKIYCDIRRKYLVVQPEEMIRQLWVQELIKNRGLSAKLIQVEKQFSVFGRNRRFDLLVFNKNHEPILLFEFKAFNIKLDSSTFEQISLYNQALKINGLVISNGINHFGASINFTDRSFSFHSDLQDILQ